MMIYTTYMKTPNGSKYLRNFQALYGRGDIPLAKFTHTFFDEVPVREAPEVCAENTTLEKAILDDRYIESMGRLVLARFNDDVPHHVHLKFDLGNEHVLELSKLPYENLLIQQNMAKLPRNRLIVTVFLPEDARQVIMSAREMNGYAGAVADSLLVDNLE